MRTEESVSLNHARQKAYILESSNACTLSIHGLARFRKLFQKNDWELVDDHSDADLILYSTCAFNQEQEDRSIETIRKLQNGKKGNADLIVCGCLPKINPKRLRKVFNGHVFSPYEIEKIDEIIKAKIKISEIKNIHVSKADWANQTSFLYSFNKIIANLLLKAPILGMYKYFKIKVEPYYKQLASLYDHHIYLIQACSGCLGNCSYCAIRRAKGTLKSVPIDTIITEFKYGMQLGYKKFALIGDDLGYYGRDIGTDLVALLEEMLKQEGEYELLLLYVEPMDFEKMFPRMKEIFKSGKIIDINIPLQSGSQRITELMNRHFNVDEVRKYAAQLRKDFPSLNVRTHIIVGFPGETEDDFEKSLEVFKDFDEVGVFEYTDRPGTPASKMTNKVPDSVKKVRVKKMRRRFLYDLFFFKLLNIKIIIPRKKKY